MTRELQALVERMIEAEAAAFKAKRAFAAAEAIANRLEVAATTAETERNHAKIALNQAIISLSINPSPVSANTPDVCTECGSELSEHDRGNSYVPYGQCAWCNNHPCGHCGLEGGH